MPNKKKGLNLKKILFITGTRADYGKIKSIILKLQKNSKFKIMLYVTGMHNLREYGYTYNEIIKDKIKNLIIVNNQRNINQMDKIFATTSVQFSSFLKKKKPDLIIVHGDRVEALACAIVGCLNNIKVGHIEGGEITGTVDEMIRHSISKISNIHFVTNKHAKKRLIQMGEKKSSIFIIGSPDVDIILKKNLPSLNKTKTRYNVSYKNYAIGILHPVTTDLKNQKKYSEVFVKTLLKSKKNYIIIYPNNDEGRNFIFKSLQRLKFNKRFKIFKSIRFEYFLTFMKNSEFIIGNSSAGIVEAPYYGTPCINLGDRQNKRANIKSVINCDFSEKKILKCIDKYSGIKFKKIRYFGAGNSNKKFINIISKNNSMWNKINQKYFKEI